MLAVAALALAFLHLRSAPPTIQVVRSSLLPPAENSFTPYNFALTPDGTRLAFVAVGPDGLNHLWVRVLSASCDGKRIAYVGGEENSTALYEIPTDGSGESIGVSPDFVTLVEAPFGVNSLPRTDPAKLSHVVNHQLLMSVAKGKPPRSAVSIAKANIAAVTPATYQPSTPDYFSENIFPVSASNHTAIVPTAVEIQSLALKCLALKSGENTAGIIWFERPGHPKELSLRVSIGDFLLDFPLSFEQRR